MLSMPDDCASATTQYNRKYIVVVNEHCYTHALPSHHRTKRCKYALAFPIMSVHSSSSALCCCDPFVLRDMYVSVFLELFIDAELYGGGHSFGCRYCRMRSLMRLNKNTSCSVAFRANKKAEQCSGSDCKSKIRTQMVHKFESSVKNSIPPSEPPPIFRPYRQVWQN